MKKRTQNRHTALAPLTPAALGSCSLPREKELGLRDFSTRREEPAERVGVGVAEPGGASALGWSRAVMQGLGLLRSCAR